MSNIIHIGGGGGGSSTLITKSITQNGTYLAQDDNADGYSEVEVDVAEQEIDKVYVQNTFSRGATPLTLTLLETANKTSHIKLTGSVWAPSIPTGYTATTGTISNNRFTTTETSEYHWDYVQEFDITCGNDNAVIVYNGELNQASEVSLNVYHIYNLVPKSITQNGTYRASDDGVDSYSEVTVDVSGGGATLGLNEGKLNVRTGAISADSDYYYSDPFPCPMTTAFFDIGESANSIDLGFAIYDANGTYTEYFTANARYRTVNITQYVPDPTGYTCRLSFSKAHLADLLFRDIFANILYANADFVTVNE